MDECDALPDAKAGWGECGNEFECARLQHETGHENSRYQRFNEDAVGLKRSVFWPPSKVEAPPGLPGPRDEPQDLSRAITQLTTVGAAHRQCISAFLHTLGHKLTVAAYRDEHCSVWLDVIEF
mgnify:CR=1 FL=1